VRAFALDGISCGNAVFNPEKLDWFNQQHIMRLPIDELARRVEPLLREAGLWSEDLSGPQRAWLYRLLELVRPRVRKLHQFVDEMRPFLQQTIDYDQVAVSKHLATTEVRDALLALPATLAALDPFSTAALESAVRGLAESHGIKAAALIHATRVAVTGRAVSPGLFEVLELLGPDRASARLHHAVNFVPK
jgi:glutamyl-tRNA synthetase